MWKWEMRVHRVAKDIRKAQTQISNAEGSTIYFLDLWMVEITRKFILETLLTISSEKT